VQADLPAYLALQLAPGELGDQHFVLDAAQAERQYVVGQGN